jgi:hypothetical protein
MLNGGKALRQIARTLDVSLGTVRRRQRWLARQSLLLHLEQVGRLSGRCREWLVLDGLRTFAGSQYEPLDLQTVVGAETGYVWDIEAAPLRRSGAMTRRQRLERARREKRLGQPDPEARRAATEAALSRLWAVRPRGSPLRLRTDREPGYARAIDDVGRRMEVVHETTSSRRRRDSRNPLWRVNHLHRLMRHSLSNQKRETLAFSKRLGGLLDRALTYLVWHNNTKGLSERSRRRAAETPAMRLGLDTRARRGEELFAWRRFPLRSGLTKPFRALYEASTRARPLERVVVERLRYAG